MLPKLEATNLIYKDLKEQPDSKMVFIFYLGESRGAVAVDYVSHVAGVVSGYLMPEMDTPVISMPIEANWIALQRDRIVPVTTKDLMSRRTEDEKELEAWDKELNPNRPPAPKSMPQMFAIPMGMPSGEDEPEVEKKEVKPAGHYL